MDPMARASPCLLLRCYWCEADSQQQGCTEEADVIIKTEDTT